MHNIIAITGASSGIGLATALKFADLGWTVYAGTRHVERDQGLYGHHANLHFIEMEVTQPTSLDNAFRLIAEQHGRLDVLFCNAGYGFLRALGQASMDDIRGVFETNVFGVMHTIRSGIELLKKSAAGHLIATTSVGGLVGQPFNEIYCASKFAVEGLLESLATYYKPAFNIEVTLLEPGAIATNFNQTVLEHVQQTGGILEDDYKPLLTQYIDRFSQRTSVPQTPESVADVMVELVVNMQPKPLRLRTSDTAEAFVQYKVRQDPSGLDGMLHTRKLHLGL
ncbi:SDR family oxidoreductase [Paenibacillus whitsoniae]|uniref:SDR family oxidoreductase n=1 Tax=Paenibacillus whitsoniae TaxID=2496558 RepID=A0A430J6V1_9BACL|nr:SDR family oxidoreductase [Paenibacillus whitsoniae]RTE04399.1 SDR family oxidoreductase [Paenibacillus whitsoniae]